MTMVSDASTVELQKLPLKSMDTNGFSHTCKDTPRVVKALNYM
jgi:hypothetical protein